MIVAINSVNTIAYHNYDKQSFLHCIQLYVTLKRLSTQLAENTPEVLPVHIYQRFL